MKKKKPSVHKPKAPKVVRPLETDYSYGGVGDARRRDAEVPNGWVKGR